MSHTSEVDSGSGPAPASALGTYLAAGLLAAAAVTLAALAASVTSAQLIVSVLLILLFAVAERTEYIHPLGRTTPTEPVFVALLLLAPLPLVPAAIALAHLLSWSAGPRSFADLARRLAPGATCIGPVLVLLIAGRHPLALSHWPIYLLALGAQFALSTALFVGIQRHPGVRVWARLAWTLGIDTLLAVIGLTAVLASHSPLSAVVLVATPTALIALIAWDREGVAQQEVQLEQEVDAARIEARLDPLTGLGNRRAWYEAVDLARARLAEDSELAAGLLAADLNFLKFANDTYGHEAGDELIVTLGAVMRAALPDDAVVCRLGGDEFAALIVAPAATLAVHHHAQRIRGAVDAYGAVAGVPLSAAIGAAASPPFPTVGDAFAAADDAVYAEKRANRTSRTQDVPHSQ